MPRKQSFWESREQGAGAQPVFPRKKAPTARLAFSTNREEVGTVNSNRLASATLPGQQDCLRVCSLGRHSTDNCAQGKAGEIMAGAEGRRARRTKSSPSKRKILAPAGSPTLAPAQGVNSHTQLLTVFINLNAPPLLPSLPLSLLPPSLFSSPPHSPSPSLPLPSPSLLSVPLPSSPFMNC